MNLYGFITIPAKYLSYALLGLDLVQGGKSEDVLLCINLILIC
jgi:hypothetical protein